MKAAVVHSAGSAPTYDDFPEPVVGEDRQLVELVAAGIHPVVRAIASGRHYGSTDVYPLVLGLDAVARTASGRLIYTGFAEGPYGTIAERISVPARLNFYLPDGADPVLVAAAMNPGMSSWLPLTARQGELGDAGLGTVLVLGATGAAGLLAVQNARALGATHIVAVGRDASRLADAADCGATPVMLTGEREVDAQSIATALGDSAPSTVLDYVWGPVAESAFAALARRGLDQDRADIVYMEIGSMAGHEAAVPASLLRSRRIRIQGSGAGSANQAALMRQIPVFIEMIASGRLALPVRAFPLAQIADAWAASHDASARVVVTN